MTLSTATIARVPAPSIWLRIALVVITCIEKHRSRSSIYPERSTCTANRFRWRSSSSTLGSPSTRCSQSQRSYLQSKGARATILVLAVYLVALWFSELPSFVHFGIECNWSPIGLSLFGQQIVFPLLAIVAIVLAQRNERCAS